jgi:hypothetical protein
MSLIFVEPWNSYADGNGDLNQNGWALGGSGASSILVASSTPRISGSKYVFYDDPQTLANSNYLGVGFTGSATIFFNSSFYVNAVIETGLAFFYDSAVEHLSVMLHTDGKIYVYRGSDAGTLLATSTLITSFNEWHHIEIKVTINNTTGVVIVKIDGIEFINISGVDTQNGGTANCNLVSLGWTYSALSNVTPAYNKLVGEVIIFDSAGSYFNDFQGNLACVVMPPTSDVTPNDFTPSTGADHYAMVDETVHDDDTTYLESSTNAHQEMFAPDSLPANVTALHGVVVENVSKKTDVNDNTISNVLKVNTTETVSTAAGITSDYIFNRNVYESNPDSAAAWALADWPDIIFGVKNTVV